MPAPIGAGAELVVGGGVTEDADELAVEDGTSDEGVADDGSVEDEVGLLLDGPALLDAELLGEVGSGAGAALLDELGVGCGDGRCDDTGAGRCAGRTAACRCTAYW